MKGLVFLVVVITASFQSGREGRGELRMNPRRSGDQGARSDCVACGIPSTYLTGQATVTVTIRTHNATGKVNIVPNNEIGGIAFTLGTRVLLTCDVTGLSEDSEVLSYK